MKTASTLGIVRHILTFVGGFAVAKDWLDASQLDTIVASVITIGGVVWSILDKKEREIPKAIPIEE